MLKTPIVCFCHLRWNFTFQRPNHLMSRFARDRHVFYVEEPVFGAPIAHMAVQTVTPNLIVCTPQLPDTQQGHSERELARVISDFLEPEVRRPILWFYTPMALPLVETLKSDTVVYDCMDELSLFWGAPKALLIREQALLARANLVFTGGQSLYEAKRDKHPFVYPFPSSVDAEHFAPGAADESEPEDQRNIVGPRIGFFGVIDERMDLELLARMARERPTYQFVLIGPVVKISEHLLPQAANLHYLGAKTYQELPRYLRGWDAAIMPFALNDSTRFISPTKTLEYMAGSKPIVSTAVRDVVVPYGERGWVQIADHETFAVALDRALVDDPQARRAAFEEVLRRTSWDQTWRQMSQRIDEVQNSVKHSAVQQGRS